MNRVGINLWREWRENRRLLVTLLVLIPLVGLGAMFYFPAKHVGKSGFAPWMGLVAIAITVMTTTPALTSRDLGRSFARRLPGTLAGPWFAKLLLVTIVTPLAFLYGAACAEGLRLCIPEKAWRPTTLASYELPLWLSLAVFVGGFWVQCVSTWLRAQLIAIPAAAALLALLALPVWWAVEITPDLAYHLVDLVAVGAYLVLAPLLVGAWSFIRGGRFEGRAWTPALAGVPLLILLSLPVWGWSTHRVLAWRHPDPRDPGIRMVAGYLDADGETVWVHLLNPQTRDLMGRQPKQAIPIRINLTTGAYEEVDGGYGSRLSLPKTIGTSTDTELFTRQFAPWRLPDGRRAWIWNDALRTDGPEGPVDLVAQDPECMWTVHFRGLTRVPARVGRGIEHYELYDRYRDRLIPYRYERDSLLMAILPTGWLHWQLGFWAPSRWTLWDPLTDTTVTPPWLTDADRVLFATDDGRVVVRDSIQETLGRLWIVDATDGTRTPLGITNRGHAPVRGLSPWSSPRLRTPSGHLAVRIHDEGGTTLARLDLERALLVPANGHTEPNLGFDPEVLGFPDDDHVIMVTNQRSIVRLRFGSSEATHLFPR
ncbi:MAG: hypothetical protein CMJ83_01780 [Planctomycetes bacterium]|nr:hypothetical protein [Planctomycetota bacterium]